MNEGMEKAQKFVRFFYTHIKDGATQHVTTMYELTFPRITADFFPDKPWPHPDALKHLVDDYVFWMLYTELYYRHLHSLAMRHDGLITFEHRKSMWDNYVALFKVLASIEASMNLPNSWLWDMIDEFMYQFQTYRALAGQANRQPDVAFLKAHPDVWAIDSVKEILEMFVSTSKIREEVGADNGKAIFESDGFIGKSNVRRMLGYFSLVGLCRFHSIMGQHEAALRALSPLNPYNRQNLYTFKVAMANINLYYYAGVSYLMLKRYIDAGRCFNTILAYIIRIKPSYKKSAVFDLLLSKNEQLYKLLALAVSLCPSVVRWCEETVIETLNMKCQDAINKMQNGSIETYNLYFGKSCPRFVTPTGPDLEGETDTSRLGYQAQQQIFIAEAEAAHQLPDLKKFLKLYTSVTSEKLAQLLDTDVSTLMAVLTSMQKRIIQKRWVAGEAISGQDAATTDIDFRLDKDKETGQDLVIVQEQRVPANHLATLAKHIVRFEQITKDMEVHLRGPAVPTAAPAAAR